MTRNRASLCLILFVFLVNTANGAEWLCAEEASQRIGDLIYSCGIGEGSDESTARAKAFQNAVAEFRHLCRISDDCLGRARTVSPGRTSCYRPQGTAQPSYRCYRLLKFFLGIGPTSTSENEEALIAMGTTESIEDPKTPPKPSLFLWSIAPLP